MVVFKIYLNDLDECKIEGVDTQVPWPEVEQKNVSQNIVSLKNKWRVKIINV